MKDNEFYQEAYKVICEVYELAKNSFIPLDEVKRITGNVIRVYAQFVPQDVRDSFAIKVENLEDLVRGREFAEALISAALSRL